MSIIGNFGGGAYLNGDANAADVRAGKKFYKDDAFTQLMGTAPSKAAHTYTPSNNTQTIAAGQFLSGAQTIAPIPAMTGSASAADVVSGKTFYNTDALSKQTGAMPIKGAQTYTPSNSEQIIAAGQFLNGAQTIAPIPRMYGARDFAEITGSDQTSITVSMNFQFAPQYLMMFTTSAGRLIQNCIVGVTASIVSGGGVVAFITYYDGVLLHSAPASVSFGNGTFTVNVSPYRFASGAQYDWVATTYAG